MRAEGDGLVSGADAGPREGQGAGAGRRRGGQGSGLHGGHPQRLVLFLLDGLLDLRAHVSYVYAGGDFR